MSDVRLIHERDLRGILYCRKARQRRPILGLRAECDPEATLTLITREVGTTTADELVEYQIEYAGLPQ
jgi:hypothetical protein